MTGAIRHRTVAIVGAGHGVGRAIAVGLAARGYRVYGSARSQEQVADVEGISGGALTLTVTDITDEDSLDAWVGAVLVSLGERGLDVVVSADCVPTPAAMLAIITAFLPSLRMAGGRVLQINPPSGTLEPLGIEVVCLHLDMNGGPEAVVAAAACVIDVVDGAD